MKKSYPITLGAPAHSLQSFHNLRSQRRENSKLIHRSKFAAEKNLKNGFVVIAGKIAQLMFPCLFQLFENMNEYIENNGICYFLFFLRQNIKENNG